MAALLDGGTIDQMLFHQKQSPIRVIRGAVIALGSASVVAVASGCTSPADSLERADTTTPPVSQVEPSYPLNEGPATPPSNAPTVLPDSVSLSPTFSAPEGLIEATRAAGATMNGLTAMQGQVMLLTLAQEMTGGFTNQVSERGVGIYGIGLGMTQDGSIPGINSPEDAIDIYTSSMAVAQLFNQAGFCQPSDLRNLATMMGASEVNIDAETERFTGAFNELEVAGVVSPTDLSGPSGNCTALSL